VKVVAMGLICFRSISKWGTSRMMMGFFIYLKMQFVSATIPEKGSIMNTKVVALASAILASSSLAFAQTTPAPAPTPQTPPAARTQNGQPMWYSHQADEMRASKLIGTKVVNAANETIGDINEVILGKDGKVAAVVLGVGGFLGMGEREVAVDFNSIRKARDSNNNLVLTMDATKDSLKAAPAWRWEDTAKR
jgi:sporulation protein YlmC with PRC-barrel domain